MTNQGRHTSDLASKSIMATGRRQAVIAAIAAFVALGLSLAVRLEIGARSLPARLTDDEFWSVIASASEPGGSFRYDNLISNETSLQHIIPELQKTPRAGAYLGVGPEQNFTYITALKPAIAFIIDIRRDNMLLHLLYKALIEMSADRAEFLSRLFARQRPTAVGPDATADALAAALKISPPSDALAQETIDLAVARLKTAHRFPLSVVDERRVRELYEAFRAGGPDVRGDFGDGRWIPTYAELMVQSDLEGRQHGFLASEQNFRILKRYETDNLIVPLVGDFGGNKTIRAVGRYLRDHHATVAWFYTSNVESYLFQGPGWRRFFANVSTLPIDERSTFIRTLFNVSAYHAQTGAEYRTTMALDPIGDLLKAFTNGNIRSYFQLFRRANAASR
jgi:hypothetical protein